MTIQIDALEATSKPAPGFDRWQASLHLAYARQGEATVPVRREHSGPLRVQKHLYPEGPAVCQHIIVHPPGGIAGGDALHIDVAVDKGAHSLLTSPGAAKWYHANGREASQTLRMRVAAGGTLEWLPQETILFDGARVHIDNRFDLAGDARLLLLDVLCLGRSAAGETFEQGRWRQRGEIRRDGRLLWQETVNVPGGDRMLISQLGLHGAPVLGTLLWVGPPLPDDLLKACRALPVTGRLGISQLPQVLAARYIGPSTEAALAALRGVWALIRPWTLGRDACPPRIWRT